MIQNIKKKIKKLDDRFEVSMLDNGYVMEVTGNDEFDNWHRVKLVVADTTDLVELIEEVVAMERNV